MPTAAMAIGPSRPTISVSTMLTRVWSRLVRITGHASCTTSLRMGKCFLIRFAWSEPLEVAPFLTGFAPVSRYPLEKLNVNPVVAAVVFFNFNQCWKIEMGTKDKGFGFGRTVKQLDHRVCQNVRVGVKQTIKITTF